MAVEKETQLEVWLEENMPESGQNPNYVEVITEKLDTLFASTDEITELINAIDSKSATAILDTAANAALGLPASHQASTTFGGEQLAFCGAIIYPSLSESRATDIRYTIYGNFSYAMAIMSGNVVDITTYAHMIDATLTIIHHPLPEN